MDKNKLEVELKNLHRKMGALAGHAARIHRKVDSSDKATQGRMDAGERKLARVVEEVQGLRARLDNLGNSAGDAQIEAILAEMNRVDSRVDDLWSDLNAELEKLRGRVDDHDKRLDDHDMKFASHGERIEGVEVRVGANASAIATLQSQSPMGIHPIAWAIGIVAGILAGWAWAVHDWTQAATVNEVKVVVENAPANSLWAAVICGVGVGLLVLFVASLLIPSGGIDETTTATAGAEAGADVYVGRGAPTMVQPAVNATPPPTGANRNAGVY